MKFKNTLILVVLAIVFGAYIYFIEFKKSEKDEKAKETAEKLIDFDKDQVKTFSLTNSHGAMKLEKDTAGVWQMTEPVKDLASGADAISFLDAIQNQKYEDVVSEGASLDLKTYGLDNPKMTFEMTLKDGVTKKILIGNDGAIAGKLYLMVAGSGKVLFSTSAIKYQMDKTAKELREKKILRFPKENIAGFSLTSHFKDSKGVTELMNKAGVWGVIQPFIESADLEAVNNVIAALDNLKTKEFVSENGSDPKELKKFKLDHPDGEIKITGPGQKDLGTLLYSEKSKSESYFMWVGSKTISESGTGFADQFKHNVDDFRDKKTVLKFTKTDVTDISIKTGLAQFHLLKSSDKWILDPFDAKKEVSSPQVDVLLTKLGDLKVTEFLAKPPLKIFSPKGEIVLKDSKGQSVFSLQWEGRTPSGKAVLAKTDKAHQSFGVDPTIIDSLPAQTLVQDKSK